MNDFRQQQDLEQQEQLVWVLKRVDMGVADHDDTMAIAAALGLSQYFSTQLNTTRKELTS